MKTKYTVKDSTSISGVEYDAETSVLTVEFKAGSKYNYTGVDQGTVDQLLLAESAGKHFAQNIKNKFVFEKAATYSTNPPQPWVKYNTSRPLDWTLEEEEEFNRLMKDKE